MNNSFKEALQSEYCTPLLAKCLDEISPIWGGKEIPPPELMDLAQDHGVKKGYYAGAVSFVLADRGKEKWISIYRPSWVEVGEEIPDLGQYSADVLIHLKSNGYISMAVGSEDYYCHVSHLDIEILGWILNVTKEISSSSKNFMTYWSNFPRLLEFQRPQLKLIAPNLGFKVFMNEIELKG